MQTIWPLDIRDVMNHMVGFAFTIEKREPALYIEIAAANTYRLFVNGKLTGYGPARSAHGFIRKDRYDFSNNENGIMVIVVEIFASNANSFYLIDEAPFFGAEIYEDDQIVAQALDFQVFLLTDRVRKSQRYSYQRPFSESYRMKQCKSLFYKGDFSLFQQLEARPVKTNQILERNVPYPDFKVISCVDEIETGLISINKDAWKWADRCLTGIDGKTLKGYRYEDLEECISDEVCEFEYKKTGEKSNELSQGAGTYKVYDFGRTLTGFFNLKIDVKQQTTLYLVFDEIIWQENQPDIEEKNICFYRNTCVNILKFKLDPGMYDLLAYEPSTARFAKIIVAEGLIDLDNFSMVLYENSSAYNLNYEFKDEKIQVIINAAANTLSQNAVDVLTDCPSRERAGWLCDGYFSGRAEKLFTGRNKVERNFLEGFVLAPQLKQLPDGMIPMCYPCDHYDGTYIPNWSMWFVQELYDYFQRTGDRELVDQAKNKIYGLVSFFKKYLNSDGLLENLESWVFIEWSQCNDAEYIKGVNYPSNMLYAAMLESIGKLYGDHSLLLQSLQVKQTIREQSFNGTFFEDNRVRVNDVLTLQNHLTETCQYYAIYFGVADKDEFHDLFETMITDFGPKRDTEKVYPDIYKSNAIVGNYLRLEILLRNNLNERVIEECKDFFYFMAQRTGTLWEHSYAYGSLNHGFASVAANYIVEAVTGFIVADVISRKISMKPHIYYCDLEINIPVQEDYLHIVITKKGRSITPPEGFEVIEYKP